MCYDKQTMILTNRGYKTFEEIGQGDNIATFNKKGRFVGWNNNWTVVRRSTDEYMFEVDEETVSLCVSEHQNIQSRNNFGRWVNRKMGNIHNRYYVRHCGTGLADEFAKNPIIDTHPWFFGRFFRDGYGNGEYYCWNFTARNVDNLISFCKKLSAANIPHHVTTNDDLMIVNVKEANVGIKWKTWYADGRKNFFNLWGIAKNVWEEFVAGFMESDNFIDKESALHFIAVSTVNGSAFYWDNELIPSKKKSLVDFMWYEDGQKDVWCLDADGYVSVMRNGRVTVGML